MGGEIIMDNLRFQDYEEFVYEISGLISSSDSEDCNVAIVAKYSEAKEIVEKLIGIGHSIVSIELNIPDWDNYYGEYLISLTADGIWCEPMLRENGYIRNVSPIIYVLDNCSSKVISCCDGEVIYEVDIRDEDFNDFESDKSSLEKHENSCKDTDESEYTHVSREKDGTPCGFTKSWSTFEDGVHSYSSYAHYSDDIDMLRKIAAQFGVKL